VTSFQETCSAILGQGKKLDKAIQEGVAWLVGIIISNFDKLNARVQKDVEEMKAKAAQERKERAERVRKQKEERLVVVAAFTNLHTPRCRHCRERLQRERGEIEEEDEGEDMPDGGDPFKRVSLAELEKKVWSFSLLKVLFNICLLFRRRKQKQPKP
jgi:hypothetical protein